jgi:hypothetical protein
MSASSLIINQSFDSKIMEDDGSASVSSRSSSVAEETVHSMRSESSRKRDRILALRKARLLHKKKTSSTATDPSSSSHVSSLSTSTPPRGILVARTNEESLNGGKVVEIKKRRRKMHLKVSTQTNSIRSLSSSSSSRSLLTPPNSLLTESLETVKTADSESSRSIQFDGVTVREYPMIVGDNPGVSCGPPVTLDWTSVSEFNDSLERFERSRQGCRRLSTQMRMPIEVRTSKLLESEHTLSEIQEASKSAAVIRQQRMKTIQSLSKEGTSEPTQSTEERIDSILNIISRPFRRNSSRRKQ